MQLFKESIEIPGEVFEERDIPSDLALVTPLVVRLVARLEADGLLDAPKAMKVKLCFDEAITNAVKHGNKEDFSKSVTVKLFRDDTFWGLAVQDEGDGFRLEDIPVARESPEESLWRENGRGLPLMALYMDECTYYDNGSTLVMKQLIGVP